MNNLQKTKEFPRQTAGRLMTDRVPSVSEEQTLGEIQTLLFKKMKEFETINYIYVIDKNKKLIGVFSIKEIFQRPEDTKVSDIMKRTLIKSRAWTDQERVAVLALRNNLKAIPVVDKDDKFLGVVTSDTILDVLHREHVEDILLVGGIGKIDKSIRDIITAPASALVKARLPWLLLGLFGGAFLAQIIGFFENTLKSQILLAFFIPVIVYISDAVATQTGTLIIRGLAIDPELSLKKYFLREIKIGSFLALILAFLLAIIAIIFWHNLSLGIILGLAMFFGIFFSVIIGVLIPILLGKFKKDPALGSGPFATIITDILSISIYFLIANLLLGVL